ncbi:MAG: heme NO-binding domain-containing protein [Gaiellaceae bacterium]
MHGIIFTSLRHFVTSRFGAEEATRIWSAEPPYLITEAYSDDAFHELFGKVCDETGSDPVELLRAFGVFAAERTFVLLYPSYFDQAGGARSFLLTVEERIHELVRATVPDARPPLLAVEPLGGDGVRIAYSSPRRLCVLLEGLLLGTVRHYREKVVAEQVRCMHRGDPDCIFEARFS